MLTRGQLQTIIAITQKPTRHDGADQDIRPKKSKAEIYSDKFNDSDDSENSNWNSARLHQTSENSMTRLKGDRKDTGKYICRAIRKPSSYYKRKKTEGEEKAEVFTLRFSKITEKAKRFISSSTDESSNSSLTSIDDVIKTVFPNNSRKVSKTSKNHNESKKCPFFKRAKNVHYNKNHTQNFSSKEKKSYQSTKMLGEKIQTKPFVNKFAGANCSSSNEDPDLRPSTLLAPIKTKQTEICLENSNSFNTPSTSTPHIPIPLKNDTKQSNVDKDFQYFKRKKKLEEKWNRRLKISNVTKNSAYCSTVGYMKGSNSKHPRVREKMYREVVQSKSEKESCFEKRNSVTNCEKPSSGILKKSKTEFPNSCDANILKEQTCTDKTSMKFNDKMMNDKEKFRPETESFPIKFVLKKIPNNGRKEFFVINSVSKEPESNFDESSMGWNPKKSNLSDSFINEPYSTRMKLSNYATTIDRNPRKKVRLDESSIEDQNNNKSLLSDQLASTTRKSLLPHLKSEQHQINSQSHQNFAPKNIFNRDVVPNCIEGMSCIEDIPSVQLLTAPLITSTTSKDSDPVLHMRKIISGETILSTQHEKNPSSHGPVSGTTFYNNVKLPVTSQLSQNKTAEISNKPTSTIYEQSSLKPDLSDIQKQPAYSSNDQFMCVGVPPTTIYKNVQSSMLTSTQNKIAERACMPTSTIRENSVSQSSQHSERTTLQNQSVYSSNKNQLIYKSIPVRNVHNNTQPSKLAFLFLNKTGETTCNPPSTICEHGLSQSSQLSASTVVQSNPAYSSHGQFFNKSVPVITFGSNVQPPLLTSTQDITTETTCSPPSKIREHHLSRFSQLSVSSETQTDPAHSSHDQFICDQVSGKVLNNTVQQARLPFALKETTETFFEPLSATREHGLLQTSQSIQNEPTRSSSDQIIGEPLPTIIFNKNAQPSGIPSTQKKTDETSCKAPSATNEVDLPHSTQPSASPAIQSEPVCSSNEQNCQFSESKPVESAVVHFKDSSVTQGNRTQVKIKLILRTVSNDRSNFLPNRFISERISSTTEKDLSTESLVVGEVSSSISSDGPASVQSAELHETRPKGQKSAQLSFDNRAISKTSPGIGIQCNQLAVTTSDGNNATDLGPLSLAISFVLPTTPTSDPISSTTEENLSNESLVAAPLSSDNSCIISNEIGAKRIVELPAKPPKMKKYAQLSSDNGPNSKVSSEIGVQFNELAVRTKNTNVDANDGNNVTNHGQLNLPQVASVTSATALEVLPAKMSWYRKVFTGQNVEEQDPTDDNIGKNVDDLIASSTHCSAIEAQACAAPKMNSSENEDQVESTDLDIDPLRIIELVSKKNKIHDIDKNPSKKICTPNTRNVESKKTFSILDECQSEPICERQAGDPTESPSNLEHTLGSVSRQGKNVHESLTAFTPENIIPVSNDEQNNLAANAHPKKGDGQLNTSQNSNESNKERCPSESFDDCIILDDLTSQTTNERTGQLLNKESTTKDNLIDNSSPQQPQSDDECETDLSPAQLQNCSLEQAVLEIFKKKIISEWSKNRRLKRKKLRDKPMKETHKHGQSDFNEGHRGGCTKFRSTRGKSSKNNDGDVLHRFLGTHEKMDVISLETIISSIISKNCTLENDALLLEAEKTNTSSDSERCPTDEDEIYVEAVKINLSSTSKCCLIKDNIVKSEPNDLPAISDSRLTEEKEKTAEAQPVDLSASENDRFTGENNAVAEPVDLSSSSNNRKEGKNKNTDDAPIDLSLSPNNRCSEENKEDAETEPVDLSSSLNNRSEENEKNADAEPVDLSSSTKNRTGGNEMNAGSEQFDSFSSSNNRPLEGNKKGTDGELVVFSSCLNNCRLKGSENESDVEVIDLSSDSEDCPAGENELVEEVESKWKIPSSSENPLLREQNIQLCEERSTPNTREIDFSVKTVLDICESPRLDLSRHETYELRSSQPLGEEESVNVQGIPNSCPSSELPPTLENISTLSTQETTSFKTKKRASRKVSISHPIIKRKLEMLALNETREKNLIIHEKRAEYQIDA